MQISPDSFQVGSLIDSHRNDNPGRGIRNQGQLAVFPFMSLGGELFIEAMGPKDAADYRVLRRAEGSGPLHVHKQSCEEGIITGPVRSTGKLPRKSLQLGLLFDCQGKAFSVLQVLGDFLQLGLLLDTHGNRPTSGWSQPLLSPFIPTPPCDVWLWSVGARTGTPSHLQPGVCASVSAQSTRDGPVLS